MTNDEIRRNDEIRMTKPVTAQVRVFDIRASDFFRHSSFVIQRLVQVRFMVPMYAEKERAELRTVLRQIVDKLILVLEFFFEPIKLLLQTLEHPGVSGVGIDVVQFAWVLLQIEQFPLVDFVEVNQLVAFGAEAVVRLNAVVLWIVIVAIIHRSAPVLGFLAAQQRRKTAPLNVSRNVQAG